MKARATIEFIGSFEPKHFLDFVGHRAMRLDLRVTIEAASVDRVAVSVSGEPDLIDAFEMACSLGPLDCLVIDVIRRDLYADPEGAMHDV